MHLKSNVAMAYVPVVVAMLMVCEMALSESITVEAAPPGTERTCQKGEVVASGLSPEHGRTNEQSHHRSSSEPVQVEPSGFKLATFGMGCFWGAEADFCILDGVLNTTVGYAGGRTRNPDYRQVSGGMTGHAEVVRVEYDPSRVSYKSLLDVFWTHHDPTTVNRQGPDFGTQYRSLILFHSPEQKSVALESKNRYSTAFWNPIVTEIVPSTEFYPAEDYHQDYLERRGRVRCRR